MGRERNSSDISAAIIVLAGIVLCNLWFDAACYKNYQDKMEIVCWMAGSDAQSSEQQPDRLDQALWLLKEGEMQSAQFLEKYGYKNSWQNQYYVLFVKQCIIFAGMSAAFFTVFLTVFAMHRKRQQYAYRAYLKALGKNIAAFRDAGKSWERRNKQNKNISRKGSGNQNANAVYETTRQMQQTETAQQASIVSIPGCKAEQDYLCDQLEMLEEELDTIREQALAEKERTKGIVTDLSHQLKTPVAALDTCFTVLESSALREAERTEFYTRCRQELEGLKALLDALVQISHMESGMIQIARKQERLLDTLVTAVNRIYPKACEKQIDLVFDYEPDIEELIVWHDAKWLCEAFVNLLDNAVKYSPGGSEIQIGIQKQVSFVRVEIADQGIGIPKEERHKVFQRFYRGSDMRVQAEGGSGVGLYLVRRIVEEHHGNVSVRGGREKKGGYPGSVFVVQVPKEREWDFFMKDGVMRREVFGEGTLEGGERGWLPVPIPKCKEP